MTALQTIIKEAKNLRAKYPKRYSKWTDYVKQASAIYAAKHKGKSPVGKKKVVKNAIGKKTIGKKKIAKKKIAKKPTEKVILKKVHSAKATSKNLYNKLDKLDEAQHEHMMGALPIGFKGSILGVNFKVINQFDIYNNVAAIIEDIKNGSTIVVIDGSVNIKNKVDQFESYIKNHSTFNKFDFPKDLNSRINKFLSNLNKEVKEYNSGKKTTTKKKPLIIKKGAKKVISHKNTLTKVKEAIKSDNKRLTHGYTMTKGNVRIGNASYNLKKQNFIDLLEQIEFLEKEKREVIFDKKNYIAQHGKKYYDWYLNHTNKFIRELKTHKNEIYKLL